MFGAEFPHFTSKIVEHSRYLPSSQQKKRTRLWVTLAAISAVVLAVVIGGLVVSAMRGPTLTPTPAPIPTPTPTASLPRVSASYSGTITASNGAGSTMSLYSIQEYMDGTIKG